MQKILMCGVLLGLLLSPSGARAADAEYGYMGNGGTAAAYNPLALVRAEDAYLAGYTGQGVRVGIWDTAVNFSHPEFAGKESSASVSSAEVLAKFSDNTAPVGSADYWAVNHHGSHVAGIIAADRNGTGMHGVAYDAELVHSCYGYSGIAADGLNGKVFTEFTGSGAKIISASFDFTGETAADVERTENIELFVRSLQEVKANDQLLVIASGNEGKIKPQAENTAWRYDTSLKNNLLSVMALNEKTYLENGSIKTTDGRSPLAAYSNLALGAEESSMLAPGSNIYSLNATFAADGRPYAIESGTSMATPVVSGVAALVQQAFPYLDAKQVGDVLLSTANKNIATGTYFTNSVINKFSGRPESAKRIYYLGMAPSYEQMMIDTGLTQEKGYGDGDSYFQVYAFTNVPQEVLFGQGVVDAGKAVRGPGALNARRLTAEAKSGAYTVGGVQKDQALYRVDTQGYNSVWSNDISEIKAGFLAADSTEDDLRARYKFYKSAGQRIEFRDKEDDTPEWEDDYTADMKSSAGELYNAYHKTYTVKDYAPAGYLDNIIDAYNAYVRKSGLAGMSVGLKKTGEGTLVLSGSNTYTGSTIVAGGTLAVNGRLAGDAYSEGSGLLTGSGVIGGNLYNKGIIRGGVQDSSCLDGTNNTLRVQGDLHSSGTVLLTANGPVQGYIDVAGAVDLTGSTLAIDGSSNFLPERAYTTNLVRKNGAEIANSWGSKEDWQSAMLRADYAADSVTFRLVDNLGPVSPETHQRFAAMQRLYGAADEAGRLQLMPLFKLDSAAGAEALQDIQGQQELAASAAAVNNGRMLAHIVAGRLNQATAMEKVKAVIGGSMLTDAAGAGGTEITLPLTMNHNDGFWLKYAKNFSHIGDGASLQSSGIIAGYDRQLDRHWRLGGFYSYLAGSSSAAGTAASNYENRLGLYGGYTNKAASAFLALDCGLARNTTHRSIRHLGLTNHAAYKSRTWEINGEYKYEIAHDKAQSWHLSPYLNGQIAWYRQDAYQESGAGVYSHQVHGLHNTYTAAGLGLELRREYVNGSAITIRVGGRHAFSGVNPANRFNYAGDAAHAYDNTPNQDQSFWTASLSGEAELGGRWKVIGELGWEKGRRDRHLMAGLTLRKVW